jgi:glycosyltransferase involved in cell wall biosynthesis
MKIAILAHSIFPLIEPYAGGLEMITHLLAKTLYDLGHNVTLFAHQDSDFEKLIPVDTNCSNMDQVDLEILKLEEVDFGEIAFAKAINQIANGNYDLVHNHSLNGSALTMLSYLNIPIIHSFHTPVIPSVLKGVLSLNTAKKIYYTSVSEANSLEWKKKILKITTIYNGIDLSKWQANTDFSENYLFWYGRLCKEKAPHLAILAAIKSNTKIIFAGPTYDKVYYDRFIVPYLNHELVDFRGHLTQAEIKPLLSNAKAFIYTSQWNEPYGLVIAESLASGTPVVGFNTGAVSEILNDYSGILVEPNNDDALIDAIKKIEQISRHDCRARAEYFCSHTRMVNSYLDLYDKVLKIHSKKC